MRFPLRIAAAVREEWPADKPLVVRIAVVDNGPGGIDMEQSVRFAARLKDAGVDAIDCSSGGFGGPYVHPIRPGYQIAWAGEIRRRVGIPTIAVGLITDPTQADEVVRQGSADLVALGREALADPAWPIHAREALGQFDGVDRFDLLPLQARGWLAKRHRQIQRVASEGSGK
jgi:2,4-dienoyl-CoA reductase-like NADH-dependent reductase (Old Yellow Enzyme family)